MLVSTATGLTAEAGLGQTKSRGRVKEGQRGLSNIWQRKHSRGRCMTEQSQKRPCEIRQTGKAGPVLDHFFDSQLDGRGVLPGWKRRRYSLRGWKPKSTAVRGHLQRRVDNCEGALRQASKNHGPQLTGRGRRMCLSCGEGSGLACAGRQWACSAATAV